MGWEGIPEEEGWGSPEEKRRRDTQDSPGRKLEGSGLRNGRRGCVRRGRGALRKVEQERRQVVCWGTQNAAGVGPAKTGGQASWGTRLLTAVESLLVGKEWLPLAEALPGVWLPRRGQSTGSELTPDGVVVRKTGQ